MNRWFNVDHQGNYKGGPPNVKRLVSGDGPEQLATYALDNITDCFLREIGRPPRREELELLWSRTLNKKIPTPFPRLPESEIL